METRRVRRIEQRRTRRIVVVAASICALGFGAGMSLPRNSVIAAGVIAVAVGSLAFVWLRAEHRARSHALTHVVRFPAKVAVGATVDALRSRVVGTARALWHRVWPSSTSDPASEAEDDGEEYFWHVDAYARDAMDVMPESQPIA
jgi:hypothetical protein